MKALDLGGIAFAKNALIFGAMVMSMGLSCRQQEALRHVTGSTLIDEMRSSNERPPNDQMIRDIAGIADINARTPAGYTPLGFALSSEYRAHDREPMVRLLLEHGARVDAQTIVDGAALGKPRIMKLLLDHGGAANTADILGQAVYRCCYCQRYVSEAGYVYEADMKAAGGEAKETVRLLIDRGAAFDIKRDSGRTALQAALENRYSEIVGLLLEHGADANVANDNGVTALIIANYSNQIEDVRLLLHAGANIEARDRQGRTALLDAVKRGNLAIVDLLLKQGARVDARDRQGRTPLMEGQDLAIVDLLLKQGAHVDARDHQGRTPLMEAAACGNLKVMQLLLDHRADPNAADDKGATVLAHAASSPAMQLLLTAHARIRPSEAFPILRSISPAAIALEGGIGGANMQGYPTDKTFIVTGSRFKRGAVICVDGHPIPTKFISAQRLEADIPTNLHPPGVPITVRNPGKNRLISNPLDFGYSIHVMAG